MSLRIARVSSAMATALWLVSTQAPGAEAGSGALQFGWRPGMKCSVEHTLIAADERIGTQTGRMELGIDAAGEDLRIRVTNYKLTGMSVNDTPEQRRQGEAMGRAVIEREFHVSSSGEFRSAEPVADVKKRLKKVRPQSGEGVVLMMMFALSDQQQLEADYLADWQSIAGNWIGLAIDPGRTQKAADGTTEVSVSSPVACSDAPALRCVTLRATTFREASDHYTLTELEAEPGSLVPHRWSEEDRFRKKDPADSQGATERTYAQRRRSYACRN